MIKQAFSRAAAKPEGSSGEDFLEAILHEREDLRKKIEKGKLTAAYPDEGRMAHTVIIGGEVFKGPKDESYVSYIDNECKRLQSLAGKGLPIPTVTHVGQETVFFAMTKAKGRRLGAGFEFAFSKEEQRLLVN